MSALPHRNARLVKLARPGGRQQYRGGGESGAVKWTGNVPVAVGENLLSKIVDRKVDQLNQTEMSMPVIRGVDVARGDHVSYLRNGVEEVRTVQSVQRVDRLRVLYVTFEAD